VPSSQKTAGLATLEVSQKVARPTERKSTLPPKKGCARPPDGAGRGKKNALLPDTRHNADCRALRWLAGDFIAGVSRLVVPDVSESFPAEFQSGGLIDL